MTFWLLLVSGAVLVGLNRVALVGLKRGQAELDRVKARWLARAAVEKGIEQLMIDATPYDSMLDYWYEDPLSFQAIELIDGSGYAYHLVAPPTRGNDADYTAYRYGMDDAASRINANAAPLATLNRFENADDGVSRALLDWRDGDFNVRPGGAEREAYDALTYPYEIRNGPLRTHRELLLISGMTPELYFGEDTNGNGLLDASEDDGGNRSPEDDADGELDPGWAGFLTVHSYSLNQSLYGTARTNVKEANAGQLQTELFFSRALAEKVEEKKDDLDDVFDLIGERGNGQAEEGEVDEITMEWIAQNWEQITVEDDERLPGQVNINTAPREVLDALPNLPDAALESLLSLRVEQGGFASVGDLFSLDVLNQRQFERVAEHLTVKSNVFTAVGIGTTPSGIRHRIEAVIDRGGTTPVVLYWRE